MLLRNVNPPSWSCMPHLLCGHVPGPKDRSLKAEDTAGIDAVLDIMRVPDIGITWSQNSEQHRANQAMPFTGWRGQGGGGKCLG
jgi:hypothetical protein